MPAPLAPARISAEWARGPSHFLPNGSARDRSLPHLHIARRRSDSFFDVIDLVSRFDMHQRHFRQCEGDPRNAGRPATATPSATPTTSIVRNPEILKARGRPVRRPAPGFSRGDRLLIL